MELKKALQIPVKDTDNLIRFFIGGLLNILPIVNFISTGYGFLMMRHQILEEPVEDLPEWNNWGTLFKYGLLTFLASLGYAIIPLIMIGLGTAALYPHVGILSFFGVTLIVVGVIFVFAVIFLYPMGLILFAIEDEFSVVFSFFRIIDLIFKHLWSYLKVFIIIFIMGIILGFLSYIPLVGWILGVFIGFYLLLETALLMGDVGREIAGTETVPAQPATSEPAPATENEPTEAAKPEASTGETDPAGEKKD
ncbi:MAG: hypothetical protein DSY91_05745 [Deltaproteobacteria bacterium]|nr:MAG: hypothetical protein DSY91_05745 [Deltaproteobacteria bacterium]